MLPFKSNFHRQACSASASRAGRAWHSAARGLQMELLTNQFQSREMSWAGTQRPEPPRSSSCAAPSLLALLAGVGSLESLLLLLPVSLHNWKSTMPDLPALESQSKTPWPTFKIRTVTNLGRWIKIQIRNYVMERERYKASMFLLPKRTSRNVVGFYSTKKSRATHSHKNSIYEVHGCASEHLKCASIIDRRGVMGSNSHCLTVHCHLLQLYA